MPYPDANTIEDMILNPQNHFASPQDVVWSRALSRDAKSRILESWKEDAAHLETSAGENMSGGERSRLREVSLAMAQLRKPEPRKADPVHNGMAFIPSHVLASPPGALGGGVAGLLVGGLFGLAILPASHMHSPLNAVATVVLSMMTGAIVGTLTAAARRFATTS